MQQIRQKTKIYTVSQVNSLIKEVLENNLPGWLTITGEITGFKLHHSGHCYFSLKDETSILPCAMWKSNFARVKFKPENGLAVLASGFIDVYVPQGKYKFIVEELTGAGVGALQLAFEQMVKKLRAEGLFDDVHKKAIPAYPERIGILTSESGAAVDDIKDSIWHRWPCVKLFLYPVPVQGEGAAQEIAAAIRDINKRNKQLRLDLLIVGRGGGSLEDLWAFNEEVLARAIFASQIPIISAVGHEVDLTVADFVADARASTPTKAGVVAVPDMHEVLGDLANKESRLKNNVRSRLRLCIENLQTILASEVFKKPVLTIRNKEQQLDELAADLADLMKDLLADARDRLHRGYEQIVKIEPHRLLGRKIVTLKTLEHRGQMGMLSILNKTAQRLNQEPVTLKDAIANFLTAARRQLEFRQDRIAGVRPEGILRKKTLELSTVIRKVDPAVKAVINRLQMRLTAQENRLAGLNPKSVLRRGYSITRSKKTGSVLRTSENVQIGDLLLTELAGENLIESQITKK